MPSPLQFIDIFKAKFGLVLKVGPSIALRRDRNIISFFCSVSREQRSPCFDYTQAFTRCQTQNILACTVFFFVCALWNPMGDFFLFWASNWFRLCMKFIAIVRDGELCGYKMELLCSYELWNIKKELQQCLTSGIRLKSTNITWGERFWWCTLGFSSANTKFSKLRAHKNIFDVHKWLLRGVNAPITRPKLPE
jgi:hypothetical protein